MADHNETHDEFDVDAADSVSLEELDPETVVEFEHETGEWIAITVADAMKLEAMEDALDEDAADYEEKLRQRDEFIESARLEIDDEEDFIDEEQ